MLYHACTADHGLRLRTVPTHQQFRRASPAARSRSPSTWADHLLTASAIRSVSKQLQCLHRCHPTQAHKPGRHASKGARARHRDQKAGTTKAAGIKRGQQNKEQRLAANKAARDAKRRTLLEARRQDGPSRLLGVLPLHAAVDGNAAWQQLFAACWAAQAQAPEAMEDAGAFRCVPLPLTPCAQALQSAHHSLP